MPQYLVTPSLYDNWRWYHLIEDKPKEEFLNTLRKIRTPPSEAMQKGIDFENDIRAVADGAVDPTRFEASPYRDCVIEIAEFCKGGLWQERVKKQVRVIGMDILLYGKADVMRRDWVRDIKFTTNGSKYEPGKYTKSIQHPLYLVCANMPHFAYHISDGKTVWQEDYHLDDDMENRLLGDVASMLDSILSDQEFAEAYLANWQTRGDDYAASNRADDTAAA